MQNATSASALNPILVFQSVLSLRVRACLGPALYRVRQVDEVMLTLKQAFTTAAALQSNKTPIQLCEACPMHDLHKLCERIEGEPCELSRSLRLES